MKKTASILLAILEIGAVWLICSWAARSLWSTPFGEWQRQTFKHWYLTHALWFFVPLIWILITRRSRAAYGITFSNLKGDLSAAMTCFLPAAIGGATLGFIPYTTIPGGLLAAAIHVGVLFLVARALKGKPDPQSGLLTVVLALVMFGALGLWKGSNPGIGQGLANFVFYLFFVGFGEEMMFRGFILSRLNQAFRTPWRFRGVEWGWGTILAALVFGLTHLLNGLDPVTGAFNPPWGWAIFTAFSALVFIYIRQKTGSIVPGAVVHGLPQAIVYLMVSSF